MELLRNCLTYFQTTLSQIKMKMPTPIQISLAANVVLASILVFAWWNRVAPAPNDALQNLTEKNSKVLEDVQRQLQQYNEQQKAAIDTYTLEIKQIATEHDSRLQELEKKQAQAAADIVKKYNGNLPGLARDFSKKMGLEK